MQITISIPGYVSFSNGLKIFHDAALEMRRQGVQVRIIPWDTTYRISDTPEIYRSLYTETFPLENSIALLPDSAPPHIVHQMRYSTKAICWWLCNIPGLLGNPAPHFETNELLVAYSRQINKHLPQFYFQPALEEITSKLDELRSLGKTNSVVVYTGKGQVIAMPPEIQRFCEGKEIIYITRFWPTSKDLLYSLIAKAQALISFDPISSLNYEATLLGTPAYLVHALRPETLNTSFNVPLHGLYVQLDDFLDALKSPFNHARALECHQNATNANAEQVRQFLARIKHFFEESTEQERDANRIINGLYNEIVPVEIGHFHRLFNATMGGDANQPLSIVHRALHIERPDLLKPGKKLERVRFCMQYEGYIKALVTRYVPRFIQRDYRRFKVLAGKLSKR